MDGKCLKVLTIHETKPVLAFEQHPQLANNLFVCLGFGEKSMPLSILPFWIERPHKWTIQEYSIEYFLLLFLYCLVLKRLYVPLSRAMETLLSCSHVPLVQWLRTLRLQKKRRWTSIPIVSPIVNLLESERRPVTCPLKRLTTENSRCLWSWQVICSISIVWIPVFS